MLQVNQIGTVRQFESEPPVVPIFCDFRGQSRDTDSLISALSLGAEYKSGFITFRFTRGDSRRRGAGVDIRYCGVSVHIRVGVDVNVLHWSTRTGARYENE